MKRVTALLAALLMLAILCLPAAAQTVTVDTSTTAIKVEAKHNPGVSRDIIGYNYSSYGLQTVYLFLPSSADLSHITLTFTNGTTKALDLTVPNTVSFRGDTYRIVGMQSDLPALYLTVDESRGTINAMNTSRDHSVYCYGSMTLSVDSQTAKQNGWATSMTGSMEMRGRGNATWDGKANGKKPYQFKLDAKADLLGMGAARTWILLANGMDASLIHNALALELAKNIGCPYTPEFRYVEMYLNGSYRGNYLLCEKVQVNEQRVNIKEMNKDGKQESTTNGGYLLEYNFGAGNIKVNHDATGLYGLTIRSPQNYTSAQRTFITNFVNEMHGAIIASNGKSSKGTYYTSYIDSVSSSMVYWVNEIVKNGDFGYGSTYLYKDTGTVLYSGPVWDFDIAFGGCITPIAGNTSVRQNNLATPSQWWLRENAPGQLYDIAKTYVYYLFQHSDFRTVNQKVYGGNVRAALLSMPDRVEYYRAYLKKSAAMNFILWPFPANQRDYSWVASNAASWPAEMDFLKNWLGGRASWIDHQMIEENAAVKSMPRVNVGVHLVPTATTTTVKPTTQTTKTTAKTTWVAPTSAGTTVRRKTTVTAVTNKNGDVVTNKNGQTVTVGTVVATNQNGAVVTDPNGQAVTVAPVVVTNKKGDVVTNGSGQAVTVAGAVVTNQKGQVVTRKGGDAVTVAGAVVTNKNGNVVTNKSGQAVTVAGSVVTNKNGDVVTKKGGDAVTMAAGDVVTDPKGNAVTDPGGEAVTVSDSVQTIITDADGNIVDVLPASSHRGQLWLVLGGALAVVAAAGGVALFLRRGKKSAPEAFRTKDVAEDSAAAARPQEEPNETAKTK